MNRAILIAAACVACIEWTKLSGEIKAINLKEQSVTIQNKEGYYLTVPVDYQVKIIDRKGKNSKRLEDFQLDDQITLIKVISEKPVDDMEGLVKPRFPGQ